MGFFTWTLANRTPVRLKSQYEYAARCKLRYGGYGAVVCPDGTLIEEPNYEGYGVFNGQDVYELVVDWNKDHFPAIFERLKLDPAYCDWDGIEPVLTAYASGDSDALQAAIQSAAKTSSYLTQDWKRCSGIHISCGERNALLPYPIKIVNRPVKTPYEKLRPSRSTQ